jgi:hypothetical protein
MCFSFAVDIQRQGKRQSKYVHKKKEPKYIYILNDFTLDFFYLKQQLNLLYIIFIILLQ